MQEEAEVGSNLLQHKKRSDHSVKEIAIIGFGLMGAQISQVFAAAGYKVRAYDLKADQLKSGLDLIKEGKYGLENSVAQGRMSREESEAVLLRISTSFNSIQEAVLGSDLVLEAAIEEIQTKRRILNAAYSANPSAILASNTSTLSISKIAESLPSKARSSVVGMHFFNPPQVMKLVEVVRISETRVKIVSEVRRVARRLGKTPITVLDSPGFIANRIGIAVFSEASSLLESGAASVRDIDLAMRLGYGYPLGPFELGDLVGLDARLRNMEALYSETKDERFKPPESLRKLVSEEYFGDPKTKKNSRGGYYEYYGLKRPGEEEEEES